jgi:cytoskeletal protein CcmA (bactofilin family)
MIWRRDDAERDRHEPTNDPREVRMADQNPSEVTVVGQGARLEGNLVSAGSLRIDGHVKGKVQAEGDVMLSPQAQVEADIQAMNVTVAGRFKGNINAKQTTELSRGGRVDGNINSKSLIVSEGAVFNGQSVMDQQQPVQPAPSAAQPAARTQGAAATAGAKP